MAPHMMMPGLLPVCLSSTLAGLVLCLQLCHTVHAHSVHTQQCRTENNCCQVAVLGWQIQMSFCSALLATQQRSRAHLYTPHAGQLHDTITQSHANSQCKPPKKLSQVLVMLYNMATGHPLCLVTGPLSSMKIILITGLHIPNNVQFRPFLLGA